MNTYRNLNVIMKYVSPHMNFQGKNTKPRLFKNFTKYQEKIMKSRPDFPNHDKIVTIKIKTGGHLVNHIKTDSRYGRKIPNKNTIWTVGSVNLKQTADLKNTLYCCNVFTYGYQIH